MNDNGLMEGIEVETVTFQMIVEAARNFRNIIKETDFVTLNL